MKYDKWLITWLSLCRNHYFILLAPAIVTVLRLNNEIRHRVYSTRLCKSCDTFVHFQEVNFIIVTIQQISILSSLVFSYLLVSALSANKSWYITIVFSLNILPISSFTECDTETEFTCNDGSCIPIEKKCDQDSDCGGGEDEQDCGKFDWSFVGERLEVNSYLIYILMNSNQITLFELCYLLDISIFMWNASSREI